MKKLLYLSLGLLVTLTASPDLCAQSFVQVGTCTPSINFVLFDWADIDHDSDSDLLYTGQRDSTNLPMQIIIYRNDGNDMFTSTMVYNNVQTPYPWDSKFADVNNDGWADILFSYHGSSASTRVFLNNGAGTFLPPQTIISGTGGNMALADIDLDGDVDIAVSRHYTIKIYRNDGNLLFTDLNLFLANDLSNLVFGDLNGDNYPGLVASGEDSNIGNYHTYLFRNNSGTTFTMMDDLGDMNGRVSLADADGDNDKDLLLTGNVDYNTPITSLFINNGNFILDSISPAPMALNGYAGWLDSDQDGDMDFICSGYYGQFPNNSNRIVLFTNNGSAVFTTQILNPPLPNERGSIAIADYNNDLYPDFAFCGQLSTAQMTPRIFKNAYDTGVNERDDDEQLQSFPSPTLGIVSLVLKQIIESGTLTVCDLTGRTLETQNLAGGTNFTVDLSSFVPGVYIIRVTDAENTFVQRIVKQ